MISSQLNSAMDNNNKKLEDKVAHLEKSVAQLTARLLRLEAENKHLKSRVIRHDQNIGSITQQVQSLITQQRRS